MQYRNTDPMTGIKITAEQEPDKACTVMVRVPAYDGTDDEESLRMQILAARQMIFALDVVAKAVPDTREEARDP